MKVQFCFNCCDPRMNDLIAAFDVAEEPTEEQCKAIEDDIYDAMDKWEEENNGDFAEFDYYWVCFEAANKHLKLVDNQVVKTFYL